MDKKKGLKIAGIVIGVLIVLVLAFTVGNKEEKTTTTAELSNNPSDILENAKKESAAVTEKDKKEFPQIDVDTYLEYYNGSEEKLILLARPTCGYCQIAEPILQKMAKDYDITIYYLNTDNFTDESQAKFIQSDELFQSGFGTPLLLIVKEGAIVDKVDGLTDTAHYKEFFTGHGYIQ